MSENTTPRRAMRLVYDSGSNAFVWIVDASDRDSIKCHVLHFDSPEEAETAQRTIASHMGSDLTIDELLELADVEEGSHESESFGDPEQIVDYLGGEADQALRGNARKMLADMTIARN